MCGVLRPSTWMSASQVMPQMKALMTLASVMLGSSFVLLGETLDVLLEGLVRPLPVVVEVPRVPRPSVRGLEVADEDQTEIARAADAARLELLEPRSGRARQKQGKILDGKVVVELPNLHGEAVVLELMVQVGLNIIIGDVRRRPKPPGVEGHLDSRTKRLGGKVIWGGAPYTSL